MFIIYHLKTKCYEKWIKVTKLYQILTEAQDFIVWIIHIICHDQQNKNISATYTIILTLTLSKKAAGQN